MKSFRHRTVGLLLAVLLSAVLTVDAQPYKVFLSSERNPDRSISLFADSHIYGEYTIKITFSDIEGYTTGGFSRYYQTSGYHETVGLAHLFPGKTEVGKLIPDKQANRYSYRYKYHWYPGIAMARAPDTSILYLLPATKGKSLTVANVIYFEELGIQSKINYHPVTGFRFHLADTICASRAGVVYDVVDSVREGEARNEVYKSERNTIHIEHRDGSLARYAFRAPIHVLVQPGDEVVPGQPLAYFTTASDQYTAFLSVYYLDQSKIQSVDVEGNPSFPYTYVGTVFTNDPEGTRPQILFPNNTFSVQHPSKVVGFELTKKERKKLGLQ